MFQKYRFFLSFICLCVGIAGLAVAPVQVRADIFLKPNAARDEGRQGLLPRLFNPQPQRDSGRASFLSRLFGGPQVQPDPIPILADLERPAQTGGDIGFYFDDFYHLYDTGRRMDPAVLAEGGVGPDAATDRAALAAIRQAPVVMAMLEDRAQNQTYSAAFMRRGLPPIVDGQAAHTQNQAPVQYIYRGGGTRPAGRKPAKVFTDY